MRGEKSISILSFLLDFLYITNFINNLFFFGGIDEGLILSVIFFFVVFGAVGKRKVKLKS